jgi:hypothetical protein
MSSVTRDGRRAWTRLGPALQSHGRGSYDSSWHDVKALHVISPPRASGNTVTVSIEYTTASRGHVQETHRLCMLVHNGTPLINTDELLSSQTVGNGGGNGNGADGDKSNGKSAGHGNGGG